MKKLLVFIMIFAVASLTSAEIKSPMQFNVGWNGGRYEISIVLPSGMSGTGGQTPQVGDGLGGYWVLTGVEPTSGYLAATLPAVMSLSQVYGDAVITGLFPTGAGVIGEFTTSSMTAWTAAPGTYASGFVPQPGATNVSLYKLDDDVTKATLVATNYFPINGASCVDSNLILSWQPREEALSCDVYFGTVYNEVNNADINDANVYRGNQNVGSNSWNPGGLNLGITYYWRIDERHASITIKGNTLNFTTMFTALGQAGNPMPANGATNVSLTQDLSWTAGSYAASHGVYFGTANPPPLKGNQAGITYDTGTMAARTTYYWRIDEKNTCGINTGTVWNFTTILPLPGAAINPTPANGATGISPTQDISWTAGSYAASHDVYFGTVNPPPFIGNQIGTTYDTGTMPTGVLYYWRIDEKNDSGTTIGSVWNFTICPDPPPDKATNPTPANGATSVSRAGVNLTWTAGSGTVASHDVYFGTTNPPQFKVNQTGTSYATGSMYQGVLYYWRIDEKNCAGTTTGDIWSFRVEESPECLKATAPPSPGAYNDWVAWGRPSCWCYRRQCRGDISGTKNIQWVQLLDLNALKSAYGKTDAQLALIPNGICADLNHTKNIQRVQLSDMSIFKFYFGKQESQVPCCDLNGDCILTAADYYNFWTN